jgi:hypothetical protein
VSRPFFYGDCTGSTRAWKILYRCFTCQRHRNALRDPQIPPDAETQVRCNVSHPTFYGNHTRLTRAWKLVRRCFAPSMHQNALRDPQIAPDAKTQFCHNVSWDAFHGNCTGLTWAWKIVCWRFTDRMNQKALCDPTLFLLKPYQSHPSMKNSVRRFMPRRHWNAVHDPQIPPNAKRQVRRNVSCNTLIFRKI